METMKKLDRAVLLIVIINTFFLRYIKVLYPEWYILDVFLLCYIAVQLLKQKIKFDFIVYLSLFFVMTVLAINIQKFGFNSNVISNILMLFMPGTLILYFIYLRKTYTVNVLELLAKNLTLFLNCYFVLNAIIVYIQYRTETFMMGKFIVYNSFIFDHMAGLIGMNGVSVLNYIWIATLLFNLYFFLESKSKWRLALLIVEFIVILVLSILNDNKMFSITFLPFLIAYFVFYFINHKISSKSIVKLLPIVFLAYVSCILIYSFTNYSEEANKINDLVGDFLSGDSTVPNANNERAYLNYMAFHKYNANDLGIGLGNVTIPDKNIHVHLGINSSSLVLIQGGIVLLISVINLYSVLVLKLFSNITSVNKKIVIYIVIFSTLLISSYATQPFRDHYIFVSLLLIYLIFYLNTKKRGIENEVSNNHLVSSIKQIRGLNHEKSSVYSP
ncbi:hypothetical protein [Paenibacillus sp. IHBB 10380]|uniref:hypothetical protein n=1 Tax=Paenibacillus sp. IHBB 10380 TaxID=1566358 RepID=UPI0005CFAD31|nr:hypothetical protein [Paenibacillus sp. IHBB 10380]AJS60039.1 hypothetical protein UB51_17920 [Paenibacillus sp. IHBB 10380]